MKRGRRRSHAAPRPRFVHARPRREGGPVSRGARVTSDRETKRYPTARGNRERARNGCVPGSGGNRSTITFRKCTETKRKSTATPSTFPLRRQTTPHAGGHHPIGQKKHPVARCETPPSISLEKATPPKKLHEVPI